MDYYNIINITKYLYFLSLLFLILISSIFILWALLQLISKRYTDLYQYKVHNFHLSIFFGLNYIILFILLLYGIRIYNVNHVLDLWEVYIDITILYSYIKDLSIVIQCYIILLCLTIFIIFLLVLIYIQKYLVHHIVILYLFFRYTYINNIDHIGSPFDRILTWLRFIGSDDLITYLLRKIVGNYFFPIKGLHIPRNVPWYNPYSILNLIVYNKRFPFHEIVTISPIIIIIYDCIFNDFIISKVFCYLLFYIPLMLLKRITSFLQGNTYYISKLLWNIYYKDEEEACIYAISEKDKRILDIYLLNGLSHDVDLGLDLEMYIESVTIFIQNYKDRPNTYSNVGHGIDLRITEDNRVFLEVEIEVETGNILELWGEKIIETEIKYDIEEEWILLADKRALEHDKGKPSKDINNERLNKMTQHQTEYKAMNNILKKFLNVFILVIGFTWIIFFLFRYPIRHWFMHLNNPYVFWLVIFLLFTVILTLIHSLSEKFNVIPLRQIIKLWNDSLLIIYWKPLQEVFDKVFKNIPGIGDILMTIGIFLRKKVDVSRPLKNFAIITSLIITILPRVILCVTFFLSIFFNTRIFFIIIPFLVFYTLIMRLFVYILYEFGTYNMQILLLYLDISYLGNGEGYRIEFKPEFVEKYHNNLERDAFRYFLFRDMSIIGNAICIERDRLYSYIKKPLNIIYLIGLLKLLMILFNVHIPNEFYLVALYECLLIWYLRK